MRVVIVIAMPHQLQHRTGQALGFVGGADKWAPSLIPFVVPQRIPVPRSKFIP